MCAVSVLAELAAQSVVRREPGRGTFVLRPRVAAETARVQDLKEKAARSSCWAFRVATAPRVAVAAVEITASQPEP